MFGKDLSWGIEARVFEDVFGGCWAGSYKVGKKIGCRGILDSLVEVEKLMGLYLFVKSD
jgi:hypothetical protein